VEGDVIESAEGRRLAQEPIAAEVVFGEVLDG